MKTNHTRAKLKRGEPSVGTWLTLPDPTAALLMAQVGFDWLTVELEHTTVTFETAAQSFAPKPGCCFIVAVRRNSLVKRGFNSSSTTTFSVKLP